MLLVTIPITSTSLEDIVSGHADVVPFRELLVEWFKKLVITNEWASPIHFAKRIAPTLTNSVPLLDTESVEIDLEDITKTFLLTDHASVASTAVLRLEK